MCYAAIGLKLAWRNRMDIPSALLVWRSCSEVVTSKLPGFIKFYPNFIISVKCVNFKGNKMFFIIVKWII